MANAKTAIFKGTLAQVQASLNTWILTKTIFSIQVAAFGSEKIIATISGDDSGAGATTTIFQGDSAAIDAAIAAFEVGKTDVLIATHFFGVNAGIVLMTGA